MKKLLATLLAAALLCSLAACGGNDKPSTSQQQEQNTPDPGTTQTGEKERGLGGHFNFGDATIDNWAQKLEEQIGISIPVPDGWSVSKVEGTDWNKDMSSEGDIYIYFDCPDITSEDAAGVQDIKDFLSSAFDAVKNKATGDIIGMYDRSKTFDTLPEINNLFRISSFNCGYWVPLEASDKVGFEWSAVLNGGAIESVCLWFQPK